VESKHLSRVNWATAKDSLADAAYQALVFYRGRRFEEARYDATYHYPRFMLEEKAWTIKVPDATVPKLQA